MPAEGAQPVADSRDARSKENRCVSRHRARRLRGRHGKDGSARGHARAQERVGQAEVSSETRSNLRHYYAIARRCCCRAAIEKLRAQNEQLKHELLLENKFSVRPGDPYAQALINRLQDEGDMLARKVGVSAPFRGMDLPRSNLFFPLLSSCSRCARPRCWTCT